jgi:hypothetical protein
LRTLRQTDLMALILYFIDITFRRIAFFFHGALDRLSRATQGLFSPLSFGWVSLPDGN